MYYYSYEGNILICKKEYNNFEAVSADQLQNYNGCLYVLNELDPMASRRSSLITSPEQLFKEEEGLNLLYANNKENGEYPDWLISKINQRKIISINARYSSWRDCITSDLRLDKAWRINVVGLGDVGSMLVTGLRLLGGHNISELGIYDLDKNKILRMLYEGNQILSPFSGEVYPPVKELAENDIFDCDMFIFCVTAGVPPLGSEKTDVRLAQFEANSRIISKYAKAARINNYKGIFAVVSDPVDHLCKSALISSNTDDNGLYDYKGLLPDQIHGYGLGVMNARAAYFASQNRDTEHYLHEGRAYGPHGDGLIIADSIRNYNQELSLMLTDKAKSANIAVRNTGFKPYIAPALSSGSLSIIDTIKGNWHYSSVYIGKVFMGVKNRLMSEGLEIECLELPEMLMKRLKETYERLSDFI